MAKGDGTAPAGSLRKRERVRRLMQRVRARRNGVRLPEPERTASERRSSRNRGFARSRDAFDARAPGGAGQPVRKKRRKRKAALLLGAGTMGLTTAATRPDLHQENYARHRPAPEIRKHVALLETSDAMKRAMMEEEGVRYTVYRDPIGLPTVGVGHLVTPADNLRVGQTISESRVLDLLDADLAHAEQAVRDLVGHLPLYQHEFDALVDLVFNVGAGNVSEHRSPRLNAAVQTGDYDAIAQELQYEYAAGQKPRGLEFRSERRTSIFQAADYADPRENAGQVRARIS
jgi:GH24 family phage-related lysozyme (muramidase)